MQYLKRNKLLNNIKRGKIQKYFQNTFGNT